MGTECCKEPLCPVSFQKPVLRSFPLPLHQDHSQLQQLSMVLFHQLMEVTERSKTLKPYVCLRLLPLYFNWHDENERVAEVRTRGLWCPHGRRLLRLLAWPMVASSPMLALVQGRGSCALGCAAMCRSLLLCRPLRKHCWVQPLS